MFILLMGEEFYKMHSSELIPQMVEFERQVQNPVLRVSPKSCWKFTRSGKFLFDLVDRFDELVSAEARDIVDNPEKHRERSDYFYEVLQEAGIEYLPVYGSHILSMAFAGRANLAMTMPWMFLHARRNPESLEKIRDDLLRGPDEAKPYLEACFRETARLYTQLSILRVTAKPVTVLGHSIPKGVHVACSPLATQRAEATIDKGGIIECASQWNPDRFLKESGAYQKWFQQGEFVQFGLGNHSCPGEKLARFLTFEIALKVWMTNYDVEVVSGLEEGRRGIDGVGADATWTEENFGTPTVRGDDIRVRIERRSV